MVQKGNRKIFYNLQGFFQCTEKLGVIQYFVPLWHFKTLFFYNLYQKFNIPPVWLQSSCKKQDFVTLRILWALFKSTMKKFRFLSICLTKLVRKKNRSRRCLLYCSLTKHLKKFCYEKKVQSFAQ